MATKNFRVKNSAEVQGGSLILGDTTTVTLSESSGALSIAGSISATSFTGDGSGLTGVTSYTDSDTLEYLTSQNYATQSYVTGLSVSTFTNDANYLDSSTVVDVVDASYIQANQTTYDTSNFADSAFVTSLSVSTFTNDANYLDSSTVVDVVDASYIQANQITYDTSNFADSAFVTSLPVSTFANDANYLDSDTATSVIDASYIQANQTTYDTSNFADSAFVTSLPISTFANDANYLDSGTVVDVVDASYIQSNQITYDTSNFADSAFVTSLPVSTFTNDANYLDSGTVVGVINASYVQSNQITYDTSNFVDSSYVTTQIDNLIGGAPGTLDTLNEIAAAINDDANAYTTLVGLITALPDSSEVSTIITNDVDQTYINSLNVNALTLDGLSAGYYLNYNNLQNTPTNVSSFANDANYLDSANVTALVDSDYIIARVGPSTDSAAIQSIIDSAFDETATTYTEYNYTATVGQTDFNASYTVGLVDVYLNGIRLVSNNDYDADNGTSITLLQGADSDDTVNIVSYKNALIAPSSYTEYEFTATADQTTFNVQYSVGLVDVYLNGIRLVSSSDYTADNGTSIVLNAGASAGDDLVVQAFAPFAIANALDKNQNLSDLTDDSAARVNLGLGSTDNPTFGSITVTGTVDGRDIASDGSKLDGIEASADVTDATNVNAAGALMRTGGTMTGNLVLNANPTASLQAATKGYVDTIAAAGLHYHTPVRVEQEGNLNVTYDNGTNGVGATLTNAGTQAALVIDGVTMDVDDRVLVYEQSDATENGIYTVTNIGSGSTNWVLTRATDADSYSPSDPNSFGQGDAFFVLEGTEGAGETYVMNTEGTITFGTTDITFAQVSSAQIYVGSTGVSIDGNEISIGQSVETTDNVTFNNITSTGIDVNGTVTADGLTVEDNAGDGEITIAGGAPGSTAGDAKLNFIGATAASGVGGYANIRVDVPSGGKSDMYFQTALSGGSGGVADRLKIDGNGDISFYEDTGTTPKFHWDASAESLGIGTSSPDYKLELEDSTNVFVSLKSSNTTDTGVLFGDADAAARGGIIYDNANNSMAFRTNTNTERLRISSDGALGIAGANYGTAGQVLTSGGSSAAPTWADASGGGGGMFSNAYFNN